eukprot:3757573-Amphidinium_carterae.1
MSMLLSCRSWELLQVLVRSNLFLDSFANNRSSSRDVRCVYICPGAEQVWPVDGGSVEYRTQL